MKTLFIFLYFILSNDLIHAQNQNEYVLADRVALSIPKAQTGTTQEIASYINANCKTDQEKIRAAYTWVTTNIIYDADSIHMVILDADNNERVTYALKRKRGVCENFAALFTDICIKMSINGFSIEGYTKQNGSVDKAPHVWCAAFVNSKWFLYDPTWDAGSLMNGKFVTSVKTNYFQKLPGEFVYTHMPFDPLFQFLDYPAKYKEFARGNFLTEPKSVYFNYIDSIRSYQDSDSLTRYVSSLTRIKNFGWPASMIAIKLKRIQFEIELIHQDNDMALYDSAVAEYNDAVIVLNDFINYRNNEFLPFKKDEEVESMFTSIINKIEIANHKLKLVNSSTATLALDTGDIQKKLDDLMIKVNSQQRFYKDYMDTRKSPGI